MWLRTLGGLPTPALVHPQRAGRASLQLLPPPHFFSDSSCLSQRAALHPTTPRMAAQRPSNSHLQHRLGGGDPGAAGVNTCRGGVRGGERSCLEFSPKQNRLPEVTSGLLFFVCPPPPFFYNSNNQKVAMLRTRVENGKQYFQFKSRVLF